MSATGGAGARSKPDSAGYHYAAEPDAAEAAGGAAPDDGAAAEGRRTRPMTDGLRRNPVKEARRRAIMELVLARPTQSQQELVDALGRRGFAATQATVSRDLHELGLVRTVSGYRATVVSDFVLSVTLVEFLAVVRTPPATANVVANAIDDSGLEGIAGTVAGDDTIIVVLAERSAYDRLRAFLGA